MVIASGALIASQQAAAQIRAPGGVTIYDSIGCSTDDRDAKVTVPFSMGSPASPRTRRPSFFATDKDAKPEIVYGPREFTADENGIICLDILEAQSGTWKVDVVEQGSGFTDSKVFTIEGEPIPPTTLPATTTPSTSTTPASTSTTLAPLVRRWVRCSRPDAPTHRTAPHLTGASPIT